MAVSVVKCDWDSRRRGLDGQYAVPAVRGVWLLPYCLLSLMTKYTVVLPVFCKALLVTLAHSFQSVQEWIVAVLQISPKFAFGHSSNISLGSLNSYSLTTTSLTFLRHRLLPRYACPCLHPRSARCPPLPPPLAWPPYSAVTLCPLPALSLPVPSLCRCALPTACALALPTSLGQGRCGYLTNRARNIRPHFLVGTQGSSSICLPFFILYLCVLLTIQTVDWA